MVHLIAARCVVVASVLSIVLVAGSAVVCKDFRSGASSRRWIAYADKPGNTGPHPIAREAGGRYINITGLKPFECLPSYSTQFKDILVVMHFSFRLPPEKEQSLHDLYSCFLPNIVRYSCTCKAPGVEAAGMHCMSCPDVAAGSEMQYMFMLDAMKANPDYAGYLFMQEDVVLGFWNFQARHRKDKVWRALTFPDPHPDVWNRHQNLSLYDASKHSPLARYWTAHRNFPLSSVLAFVRGFTTEEQQRLFWRNSNSGQETFKMANSDMYYVPARYSQQYIQACERAVAHKLFHEIAVPIMLDVIVPEEESELAVGGAVFHVTDSIQKISLYDPCWDFYHKMKPSKDVEWVWLVETIMRYGPMAGSWDCGLWGLQGLTSYARVEG